MYSTPSNTPGSIKPGNRQPIAWFVGVPWVSGGRDPARGCDCWGLIMVAARNVYGVTLPDYRGYTDADDIEQTGRLFENRDAWEKIVATDERPGDVIVLKLAGTPAHAGLVVGDGLMLHSLRGRDSCLERYRSRSWVNRIEGFYRWQPH